jgi:hypothetical protein
MFGGLMTETQFLDGMALLLGAGLMFSGVRAIRRREVEAEGHHEGAGAVRLGWLWFVLGALFVAGVLFDVPALQALFRIFLEAPS